MSDNTNIFVIKKKQTQIINVPFYVKFDQEYVDFSEVEHNWYFDWDNCSGYLTIGNNNWGNGDFEYFISRQEQNFIGWEGDRNNSKQIYYGAR